MLKETLVALNETGLTVAGIEVVRIGPRFHVDDIKPILESGAILSAATVTVYPVDTVAGRLARSIAVLAHAAGAYGMKVLVEPMVYNSVPSLAAGIRLINDLLDPRVGLIIDALHFQRFGGKPSQLAGLDGKAVSLLQLCDGPLSAPHRIPNFDGPLPRQQSANAPVLALEGRAFRQLPGLGELPLVDLVRMLPTTPLSVEAPDAHAQRRLSSLEIARISYNRAQEVVAKARSVTASPPVAT